MAPISSRRTTWCAQPVAFDRRPLFYQRRAQGDVREAYLWYEDQRRGLGEQFLAALKDAEDLASTFPASCAVVHRTTRRVLLKRFPYGLYFRMAGVRVIVVACYHCSRDPEGWKRRR